MAATNINKKLYPIIDFPWSKEEWNILRDWLNSPRQVKDIAQILCRSPSAIRNVIRRIREEDNGNIPKKVFYEGHSPFKGMTNRFSIETRKKMREAALGRIFSIETRAKLSISRRKRTIRGGE